MSLIDHARRELALSGDFVRNPAHAQSLVAAVAAFASYDEHSGTSAQAAIAQLTALLRFETLSPLTDHPDEWMLVTGGLWQSRRDPTAFSTDGGATFYLLAERDAAASPEETPIHHSKSAGVRSAEAPS